MNHSWMNSKEQVRERLCSFTGLGRWPVFLLLCGYVIFCHGCHAHDVDDELSVPLRFGERDRVTVPREQTPRDR